MTSTIEIAGLPWRILSVASVDELLDEADDIDRFPFGLVLWESAVALSLYLSDHSPCLTDMKVLELGAGAGIAGLVARSLGAQVSQTDNQSEAIRLAEQNAMVNGISGITRFMADWRTWTRSDLYDVLIAADITYERSAHFYLEEIFSRNLAPGGSVYLSDPGRPQTLEFMGHLETRGWSVEMETQRTPHLEHGQTVGPTDVAIFTIRRGTPLWE